MENPEQQQQQQQQKTNVLLTLPNALNEKLQIEAKNEQRKRHAQIIFILERFFESANKKPRSK